MAAVNSYLIFAGKTEEAFNFYKSVFGGEFNFFQRFIDTPHGAQMSPEDQQKVLHVSLPIGNGTAIMATDALESMGQTVTSGNNFSIAIAPDSLEEATKLFNGLAEGGNVTMPMEKMFWGAYYGQLTDKYGIQWMVNYADQTQN